MRSLMLHGAAFLLGLSDAAKQFLTTRQQEFVEFFDTLLFHGTPSCFLRATKAWKKYKTKRPRLKESWDARLNSPPPSAARFQGYV